MINPETINNFLVANILNKFANKFLYILKNLKRNEEIAEYMKICLIFIVCLKNYFL